MMKGHVLPSVLIALLGGFGCGGNSTSDHDNPKTPNPATSGNTGAAGAARQPRAMTPGPRPTMNAMPAPDDSEVSVALARDLVKTRTFKSHPQLAKIEEITDGTNMKKKTIKVYLKSGEIKEIADDKIGDPMTVPAATILSAIGRR